MWATILLIQAFILLQVGVRLVGGMNVLRAVHPELPTEWSTSFDLRDEEEFLWVSDEPDQQDFLGSLKITMPRHGEHILNAERISPYLDWLMCEDDGVTMSFNDEAAFERAKITWDWANGEDDRYFVIVIGVGDCDWNSDRQPYMITSLAYDEVKNVATLRGSKLDWHDESIVHSFHLVVGQAPAPSPTGRNMKRGFWRNLWQKVKDKSHKFAEKVDRFGENLQEGYDLLSGKIYQAYWDLPINAEFSPYISVNVFGVGNKVSASGSKVSGVWRIFAEFQRIDGKMTKARIAVVPLGVEFSVKLSWTIFGTLTPTKTITGPKLSVGIPGFSMGSVFSLGPALEVYLGASIGPIKAGTKLSTGLKLFLPEGSFIAVDFLNKTDSVEHRMKIHHKKQPFKVEGAISAAIQVYLAFALSFRIKLFKQGASADITLKAPYFNFNLEFVSSTRFTIAVGAALSVKAKISFFGWSWTVIPFTFGFGEKKLFQKCIPFKGGYKPLKASDYSDGKFTFTEYVPTPDVLGPDDNHGLPTD